MSFQDSFGVWGELGTIVPRHDAWQEFSLPALETNSSIRIVYFCSDWTRVNSFAWLRVFYKVGGQRVSEPSRKIYPRDEPLLIQLPPNPDFVERGVTSRSFEVRKQLKWSKLVGPRPDINWSMKIQELWG